MRSALVIVVGSRGDTEPLVALTGSMLQSGKFDTVHLCVQPDYLHMVPEHPGIVTHELPFGVKSFRSVSSLLYFEHWKAMLFSFFTGHFDPIRPQTKFMSLLINRFFVPALPSLYAIAKDAKPSLVLSTTLVGPTGATLAECLQVPMYIVNFQPNTPTSAYPYYMTTMENALLAGKEVARLHKNPNIQENPTYLGSYASQNEMHAASLPGLNSFRSSVSLQKLEIDDIAAMNRGEKDGVHVLNSYPLHLIPPSPDWSPNVHQVPALADDFLPTGWTPEEKCPDLVDYLGKGAKPLCVSFGSMSAGEKKATVSRELLAGMRAAGLKRIVILKGAADLGEHNLSSRDADLKEWAARHVHMSDESVQYAWLLPQCSGILCHGGAGTLFAALRAGIPIAIAPILCDQFFWGQLIHDLRLGAVAGPSLQEATSTSFEAAIQSALSDEIRDRVAEFGKRERNRVSGREIAAELLGNVDFEQS